MECGKILLNTIQHYPAVGIHSLKVRKAARIPVELIYTEEYDDKIDAQRRDYAIKQLTRAEKEALMNEKKMVEYAAQAKSLWGDTDAFKEFEEKDN